MRHEFRLADIGEGLEEAEVIEWRVGVGDLVQRDQPLIEVMTDKSNAELPAPAAGTIVELGAAVGDMLAVGEIIAIIEVEVGADAANSDAERETPERPASEPDLLGAAGGGADAGPATDAVEPVAASGAKPSRPKASPSTRRAAAERGIDLAAIRGSGPGGRILLTDLDAAIVAGESTLEGPSRQSPDCAPEPVKAREAVAPVSAPEPMTAPRSTRPPVASEPGTTVPLRGIRRAVAQNMARAWFEIPHIHAFEHIDAEPLRDLRKQMKAVDKPEYAHLTPLAFFVAATASALVANPEANASINMSDETITYHSHVNVGVAVASPQGLVVPVLPHADTLSFTEICRELAALVSAARSGTLPRENTIGGTVTITNFGSLGGEQAAPIIRPPEAMIVGFGSMAARPYVVDGDVVARQTMHVVAGADHRLLDGDTTTSVLRNIADSLMNPLRLVL